MNMMRALLLQKEVIRPSIHPIIRRMQRLPKKQLSFQINANQCIFLQFANSDFAIRKKFTLHSELRTNGKCGRLIV